jgi:hypothetical protein
LLAIVFLVDEHGLPGGPVIISPHLWHQILKQLILFRCGKRIIASITQVCVLCKIDASGSEIFVAVAAIVFDNIGVSSRTIWRIVHVLEWLNQFCLHRGLIFYSLDVVVEGITTADALAEGLRLQTTVAHDHIRVAARAITTVCCELLMIRSVTRQHCRSVHFCFEWSYFYYFWLD